MNEITRTKELNVDYRPVSSGQNQNRNEKLAEFREEFDEIFNGQKRIGKSDLKKVAENRSGQFSQGAVESAKMLLNNESLYDFVDNHAGKYNGDGEISKNGLKAALLDQAGIRQAFDESASQQNMLEDALANAFGNCCGKGGVTKSYLQDVINDTKGQFSDAQKSLAAYTLKAGAMSTRDAAQAGRDSVIRGDQLGPFQRSETSAPEVKPNSTIPTPKAGSTQIDLPPGLPADDARILSGAGVPGGVKKSQNIVATVPSGSSGADIQAAIDKASKNGGGVVILEDGQYNLYDSLQMKSNVILRGTRDASLVGQMTSRRGTEVVTFDKNVSNAGLEGLTVTHGKVTNPAPKDFKNREPDLNVSGVVIRGDRNWIDGANIYNNGTDPVDIKGNHNTVQNSVIDGSANKGGGGNGYFSVNSDRNLIINNEIHNIRHMSIQGGAQHNVVQGNNLTTDINFHNGDDGHNAILHNSIDVGNGHNWDAIATGGAKYGHKPPGDSNYLYGNDGAEGFDKNKLMSFSGYRAARKYQM